MIGVGQAVGGREQRGKTSCSCWFCGIEQRFEVRAEGWLARIFQHEYDHLDGVLYVDRLAHPFGKAAAKVQRKNSWGVPGLSWLPGRDHLED